MWKRRLSAPCMVLLAGVVWAACSGDAYIDVEQEPPCDSTADCGSELTGAECIDGRCRCPELGDVSCCEPGAREEEGDRCERACRPVRECVAAPCEAARDCPGPVDPRCGQALCVAGVCRLALREQLEHQRAGDCRVVKCDDAGAARVEHSGSDVFNDGNECTIDRCAHGTSVHLPHPTGPSPETSGYCKDGKWVGCLRDEDCGNPSYACSTSGRCVHEWCENGILDVSSGETALDCGGPCDPCESGQPCDSDDDCVEQICAEDGTCAHARCGDRVLNGAETDVDCGAPSCPACDSGQKCGSHESCQSGVCMDGVCRDATCSDGVMNGDEAARDCGGSCAVCPLYVDRPDIGHEGS
ncbi:uncharacterized protein SOCEGT47_077300 [Sorangium cellulosum]|uniref:Tryptophan synthase alpha chain n=1 Tax=Sorangium cellulosum TaxID=56 RepID=A0A4P2QBR0_SORCE|nr:hypothetical protein [Sorangium cellulosum]AUX27150.1 uncharacterized protein SOCEGT47_077300 [Sorangium cellulosum]